MMVAFLTQLRVYLPLVVVIGIGISTGAVYFYRTSGGKRAVHRTILQSCPSWASSCRKISVARFTRTLGTLLQSGVPILDALEIFRARPPET